MVGGRREQVERERAKGRLVLLPREGSVVATGLRAQPSRANQTLSQDSTIFSSKDSDTGGLSACFSHQAEWRDYQTLQSRNPRDWPASGQTTSCGRWMWFFIVFSPTKITFPQEGTECMGCNLWVPFLKALILCRGL